MLALDETEGNELAADFKSPVRLGECVVCRDSKEAELLLV
jgi:hypothetical protein